MKQFLNKQPFIYVQIMCSEENREGLAVQKCSVRNMEQLQPDNFHVILFIHPFFSMTKLGKSNSQMYSGNDR